MRSLSTAVFAFIACLLPALRAESLPSLTVLLSVDGNASASALQELLRDYKMQRDAVGQLVSELRATVELARKEASLTGDVLARIESSATRLGTAQKQADEYLAAVSRVLGEAHTTFATEVKRTLEKANTEFHNKLSGAVGLLSSGVQELEVTLAAMGNMKPARV